MCMCRIITPQSPSFIAVHPRRASSQPYLISSDPLASVHYKAVRTVSALCVVMPGALTKLQSKPPSNACRASDHTTSLIPHPTAAQSRVISQLGQFIKPITWTSNNAECTMYSNKMVNVISLFCNREWSWRLPGDLIVINGWWRQALELRTKKMVVTRELQDVQTSSQIVTTNKPTPSFLQAGCPSCRPTNSVKAPNGGNSSAHINQSINQSISLIQAMCPIQEHERQMNR